MALKQEGKMDETTRTQFFQPVLRAMQDAEELGGPEAMEYVELMQAIIAEAMKRKQVVIERIAKGEIGNHWDL